MLQKYTCDGVTGGHRAREVQICPHQEGAAFLPGLGGLAPPSAGTLQGMAGDTKQMRRKGYEDGAVSKKLDLKSKSYICLLPPPLISSESFVFISLNLSFRTTGAVGRTK